MNFVCYFCNRSDLICNNNFIINAHASHLLNNFPSVYALTLQRLIFASKKANEEEKKEKC